MFRAMLKRLRRDRRWISDAGERHAHDVKVRGRLPRDVTRDDVPRLESSDGGADRLDSE